MTSPALQDIVALFGCPAAGNPAQYLFERAIAAAGLDWRFLSVDVTPERLQPALAGAAAMGFRGCMLAGPLEEAAPTFLARLTPAADFAGAANLVEATPDGLLGHITGGRGIVEALRAHAEIVGARVLVAGAGVLGRATALELALSGAAAIVVADRDAALAGSLAHAIAAIEPSLAVETLVGDGAIEVPEGVGLVVAARGVGEPCPRFERLRGDLVLADTALADQASPVLRAGREAGCCVIDGIEIHVERAAIDFRTLTGVETDPDLLREALEEFLSA
ncbi:MAG: shikimate dehydrogenase family protein [Planctomycetaceae bacterium]